MAQMLRGLNVNLLKAREREVPSRFRFSRTDVSSLLALSMARHW